MSPDVPRALVPQHGLARAAGDGSGRVAEAQRRLSEILARVTELDLAVEALSLALGDFGRRYEQVLGAAFRELDAAERLVRRLQALEDEAARGSLDPGSPDSIFRMDPSECSSGRTLWGLMRCGPSEPGAVVMTRSASTRDKIALHRALAAILYSLIQRGGLLSSHGLPAAMLIVLSTGGCSWVFVQKPPAGPVEPTTDLACTSSPAAPIADTIWATANVVVALLNRPSTSNTNCQSEVCTSSSFSVVNLALLVDAAIFGVSAYHGYKTTGRCRELKELQAACPGGDSAACRKLMGLPDPASPDEPVGLLPSPRESGSPLSASATRPSLAVAPHPVGVPNLAASARRGEPTSGTSN